MMIGFCLSLCRLSAVGEAGPASEAENTVAPSISGDGLTGAEHTGSDGTWTGAEAYERRWRLNGTVVGTGSTYTPATAGSLVFQVRGQDANGVWSAWVNSEAVDIIALPSNDTAPVVTGNATIGVELAGSNGAWSGSPTITYDYQWQRSDDGSTGWSNISGATSIDYTLDEADEDKYVRLQVTATNDGGSVSAASNVVGPVLAVAARTIVTVGHSLMDCVSWAPLMYLFPNDTVERQTIPGAPLKWNWDYADTQESPNVDARTYIAANAVDWFIMAESNNVPDVFTSQDTVDYLQIWRTQAISGNANVKVWWHQVWDEIPDYATTPDYEGFVTEQLADATLYNAVLVEAVNETGVAESIHAIPCGYGMALLVQAILDNEVADITDPGDLFSDEVHLAGPGRYFISMMFFSALTKTTPVGLPYQISGNKWDDDDYLAGVTENMAADMQLLAWSVVSTHPFAGIAAWPGLPSAFTSGQWSLTAGDTEIDVTISTLPDSDQPITDVEYRVDGGSWVSSGGTVSFTIGSLTNSTEYDIELRAVSIMGAGAASDTKSATPVSSATVPDAFTSGLWSLTAGDEDIDVTISSLPSDGGATITDIEYRLDGGSAVSTGGITDFTITGLTNDVEYDVEIRAVNSVGAGAWSDLKSATPEAAGSGVTYSVLGTSLRSTGTIDLGSAAAGKHVYVVVSVGWGGVEITGGSLGDQTLTSVANQGNEAQILRCTTPPSGSQSFSLTGLDGEPLAARWFAVLGGGTTLTDTLEAEITGVIDEEIDGVAGGLVIYNAFAYGSIPGMTGTDFTNTISDENEWTIAASGLIAVESSGSVAIEQTSGTAASTSLVAVAIPPA